MEPDRFASRVKKLPKWARDYIHHVSTFVGAEEVVSITSLAFCLVGFTVLGVSVRCPLANSRFRLAAGAGPWCCRRNRQRDWRRLRKRSSMMCPRILKVAYVSNLPRAGSYFSAALHGPK